MSRIPNRLKRVWYRLNSKLVYPEQVKYGDQLLFDFPGTGPYWTSPVLTTAYSWDKVWVLPGPMVWIWFQESSSALGVETKSQSKVRVRR